MQGGRLQAEAAEEPAGPGTGDRSQPALHHDVRVAGQQRPPDDPGSVRDPPRAPGVPDATRMARPLVQPDLRRGRDAAAVFQPQNPVPARQPDPQPGRPRYPAGPDSSAHSDPTRQPRRLHPQLPQSRRQHTAPAVQFGFLFCAQFGAERSAPAEYIGAHEVRKKESFR